MSKVLFYAQAMFARGHPGLARASNVCKEECVSGHLVGAHRDWSLLALIELPKRLQQA